MTCQYLYLDKINILEGLNKSMTCSYVIFWMWNNSQSRLILVKVTYTVVIMRCQIKLKTVFKERWRRAYQTTLEKFLCIIWFIDEKFKFWNISKCE